MTKFVLTVKSFLGMKRPLSLPNNPKIVMKSQGRCGFSKAPPCKWGPFVTFRNNCYLLFKMRRAASPCASPTLEDSPLSQLQTVCSVHFRYKQFRISRRQSARSTDVANFPAVSAANVESTSLWDLTPCGLAEEWIRFRRTCCLRMRKRNEELLRNNCTTLTQYTS